MILHSATDLKNIPRRIVSLVPSQTELLYFLGLEEETIAITKFCVHPAKWPGQKIIIGGTKNIHLEQVKNLHPDLIVANKEENTKEQVEELAKEYPVWVTNVNNLDDALQMIQDIGQLTNTALQAGKLVENITALFSALPIKNMAIPTAYLVWRNPFMTIGGDTFINDMLKRCGLQNIFAGRTRYPEITINELRDTGCSVLLLSSEPYPFNQKHIEELQAFLPGIKILLTDGEIFSWYGSRLLKAPGYFRKFLDKINSG
ncbi:MAG: helical backbone metal receptor [Ferruginibacter sp.]